MYKYAYKDIFKMWIHYYLCLCITNLFVMLIYLFSLYINLYIKLFDNVDSFVRDIHFQVVILYNQMFAPFTVFVRCTSLFVRDV